MAMPIPTSASSNTYLPYNLKKNCLSFKGNTHSFGALDKFQPVLYRAKYTLTPELVD